jgi:hypothetical protein
MAAFCMRQEPPDLWEKDKYPYRIVTKPDSYYFVNESGDLEKLEGTDVTKPPIDRRYPINVPKNTIANFMDGGLTDAEIMLSNFALLIGPFGNKIPYINGEIRLSRDIEPLIVSRRAKYPNGDPKNIADRDPDKIYLDEYIKYTRAVDYLCVFNHVFVPGGSIKLFTVHPEFFAYRASLLKEYEGKLNNPVIASEFVNKLLKWDYDNWLAGDPSLAILKADKKSLAINRSRVLLCFGGERSLAEGVEVNFVVKSLLEGWDLNNVDIYFNAQRKGSYSRGAETVLGGVVVKEMTTLAANARIIDHDCGSTMGNEVPITENNFNGFVGRHYIDPTSKKAVEITQETKARLVGRTVSIRIARYCKHTSPDFCGVCCGPNLAAKPKALGVAINSIGHIFLEIYMGAAHVKELQNAFFDHMKAFGMFYINRKSK